MNEQVSIYLQFILDVTMEETIALLKSCIISKKGGVPIEDLNGEFFIIFIFHIREAN